MPSADHQSVGPAKIGENVGLGVVVDRVPFLERHGREI